MLDKDNGLEDKSVLCNSVKNFFKNDNIKSFNIKSPYDTGTTQLLKQIIGKYNPERVLWLSYRKTYTYDIAAGFRSLGFETYLDKKFNADRLIIQLESLLHLRADDNVFLDDEGEIEQLVPSYDLVVVDEIESILNQFSSDATFKIRTKKPLNLLNR